MTTPNDMLTLSQAAMLSGISASILRDHCERGWLPAERRMVRGKPQWYVTHEELQTYREKGRYGANGELKCRGCGSSVGPGHECQELHEAKDAKVARSGDRSGGKVIICNLKLCDSCYKVYARGSILHTSENVV